MSSLGIFDKETKTYKKVAGTAEAAVVDDALSSTSTNPVQNKVVTSNLTGLKYGEVAGGKNLFNGKYIKELVSIGTDYTNRNLYDEFSSVDDITGLTYVTLGGYFRKGKYTLSYSNDAWFSFNRVAFAGTEAIVLAKQIRKTYTWEQTQDGYTYFSIEADDSETGIVDVPFSITPDIQLEEGDTATPYEPYIPSIKMLAEENAQQSKEIMDIKMLGWAVPSECPIKNEVNCNQFIQKVGRVDLGSLDWSYLTNPNRFNVYFNSVKFVDNIIPIVAYSTKYDIYSFTDGINKDKAICVWGDNSIASYLVALDSSYTDVASFKQAMQGQYLYYELATPITKTIDGNEIGETVSDIRKETTVNLLNPTLQTTTLNGVTCTNNGDGTYTLNGTATSAVDLIVGEAETINGKQYLCNGVPVTLSDSSFNTTCIIIRTTDWKVVHKNGTVFTAESSKTIISIHVESGITVSNAVFKPMLTTNLSATYEDFVPYTGSTGKLNGDVAELKAEVANNRTVVDAAMSDTSTNPVQNKVIKKYVDDHAPNITVDDALSATSTNPVQNKVITSNLTDLKKETTVNLLNPTLETTTKDGITCTNNGDGTYTLNGTATSSYVVFKLQHFIDTLKEHLNEELLLVGCPKHDESINMTLHLDNGKYHATDTGNGAKFNMSNTVSSYVPITIEIGPNGTTVNNLVFKPMITTNINATYDDFVPYTGDTGKLNSDVSGLAKKIPKFVRNDSVFYSSAGHSPVITGDTAGRFSAISDEWSDDKGRVIKFKNDMDTKTHITIYANVPVHNALFLQAYSPSGASVEVKRPLFFYTQSSDDNPVQTISCDVTAPVGTEVSIAFNPILIKNI